MAKNFFDKPFDEGTKVKLEIFKGYFKEWLPVFISRKELIWDTINIYDFFAGGGQDVNGLEGSPLIVLNELAKTNNSKFILSKKIKINVCFNEKDEKNFESLKKLVETKRNDDLFHLEVHNKDFKNLFDEKYEQMNRATNFLFLDQFGIKEISPEIFKKIIDVKPADYMFFISSSIFNRFKESEELNKYLNVSKEAILDKSYHKIHEVIFEAYKSMLPQGKEYYLAPFSIKKEGNIYGLIFGSHHTLGLEKFLKICWRLDPLTGDSNYDMENEKISNEAPSLFEEYNIPKKRQVFERDLRESILNGKLKTGYDAYLFSLTKGFLAKDANPILDGLKSEKKIIFDFKTIKEDIHKIKKLDTNIIVN